MKAILLTAALLAPLTANAYQYFQPYNSDDNSYNQLRQQEQQYEQQRQQQQYEQQRQQQQWQQEQQLRQLNQELQRQQNQYQPRW